MPVFHDPHFVCLGRRCPLPGLSKDTMYRPTGPRCQAREVTIGPGLPVMDKRRTRIFV